MILLYTGAKVFNTLQNNPDCSLGGILSSSIVPNGLLNNLFSDMSSVTLQNLSTETKALVLKNTTGGTVTNVTIGFEYPPTPIFKLQIGIVNLDPSGQFMESIGSTLDLPYNCVFYEPFINESVDNSLIIPSIANNGVIGIWFSRSMLQQSPYIVTPTSDPELTLLQSLATSGQKNINNINLVINYNN